jgi:hypothetical protein
VTINNIDMNEAPLGSCGSSRLYYNPPTDVWTYIPIATFPVGGSRLISPHQLRDARDGSLLPSPSPFG